MDIYPSRRDRLLASLKDEGIEALLVSNPLNVTYLTGFSGESSFLVLAPGRTVLISDGRFTDQLQDECADLEAVIRPPHQPMPAATAATLEKLGLGAIGVESAHLTVSELEQLASEATTVSWKPGPDRVERLRQVKDAWEIEQIREAIRFAERAYAMFRAMLRPEDTEKDSVDALEMYVRRAGGKCSAFPPIVAVGQRAALPHAPPTNRLLAGENLILVDWGAAGAFYKSDLTRVLVPHDNAAFSGRNAEARLGELYEVVLRAQASAIAALRPGVKAGDVDAAARRVIADAGHGEHFTHSTGHGFGLQIHEAPLLRPGSELVLQAGMVVTVEPGIYLPGWGGIRIEDDILLTQDGAEALTSLPRDFPSTFIDL